MGLGLTHKRGKLESIKRQTALFVLVFSWDLLTIAEIWNITDYLLAGGADLHNETETSN